MLKNLGKTMKRYGALLCAMAVAMLCIIVPTVANAAITEINRTYDKSNNSLVVLNGANHRSIKDGNIIVAHERFDSWNSDPVFPNESSLTIVTDPISGDESDKVVRIAKDSSWTNTANGTVNQYGNQFPINGIKSVTSFNFMLDGDLIQNGNHPLKVIIQSASFSKNMLVAKIQAKADGTTNVMSFINGLSADINQRQWYNLTLVCEMSGETVEDRYIALYLNGEEMAVFDGEALAARSDIDTASLIAVLLQPGVTSGTESVLYYDDYRVYEPTNDTASITLTSPVANTAYMNGAKVKLEAKTYLSTDLQMIEKVEYYDGDTKVAESSVAPYTCYYQPTQHGIHSITAKMYVSGARNPIVTSATSIEVDRAFEETTVTSLNDYTGTIDSAVSPGTWRISASAEPVVIDEKHGKSLRLTSGGNHWVNCILPSTITDGYVKISGEYYIDSHVITEVDDGTKTATANTVNNTLIAHLGQTGAGDVYTNQISGTTLRTYINKTQNMTNLTTMLNDRWYKIDLITKVKPSGQGYIKIYIDGQEYFDSEMPLLYKNGNVSDTNATTLTAIDKIANVTFAQLYNQGTMVLDNLSISKLEMNYDPVFYSDGNMITSMSQIVNKTVTAETTGEDADECQLLVGLFDSNGTLQEVKFGTLAENEPKHTATFDLSEYESLTGMSIKAFVWNSISEMKPMGALNELK